MTEVQPLTGCEDQFRDLQSRDVEIPYGRFTFPCRFRFNPDARYLGVQLHGRTPRGEGTKLPVFARWNWGKVLGAHVLSICDPTLYRDDDLIIGWYLGDREESAIPGVVAIAERCADEIGIGRDRIIYSGGSGGGFAALQAAALAKNGKAIAINAQTDLLQYSRLQLRNYVSKVSGCATVQEAQSVFGNRWNATHRLQAAIAAGNRPKIVIVQNRNEWHYEKHFTPFAEAFGLNLQAEQSTNGNFMAILYDGAPEHGPEPTEVVKRNYNEGLPFLLDEPAVTSAPEFSLSISLEEGKIRAGIQAGAGDYQFACYLYKDNAVIEKQPYAAHNTFSFNCHGPGKYQCRGFLRNAAKDVFARSSKTIQVND